MITLMDAIQALRPGAECNIRGNKYSGIEWLDKAQTIPSEEDVTAKYNQLQGEEPLRLLREERNKLIAETDWTQLKDIELDSIRERDWKNYRQALRDLPSISRPTLDENGNLDMSSVTWPDKPSS